MMILPGAEKDNLQKKRYLGIHVKGQPYLNLSTGRFNELFIH